MINITNKISYYSSYNAYSNEVTNYGSPYGGYSTTVTPQQQAMGYDISADYVDSTTTYEPRSTIIDSDFIGGHSKCRHLTIKIFFFAINKTTTDNSLCILYLVNLFNLPSIVLCALC